MPASQNTATIAKAMNARIQRAENAERVRVMGDMMAHSHESINNPRGLSVDVLPTTRLAERWNVKPKTAHWLLYAMDRGVRARVIDVLQELGPDAVAWFAPVMEAFWKSQGHAAGTLHDKGRADFAEDRALEEYRHNPTPANRRLAYLAIEKAAMVSLGLADAMRAEEEAERE